jgi:hypothetical protein
VDETTPLDVAAVIGAQAYAASVRYGANVDKEDLEQEAWVWVVEHPGKMKEHEANPNPQLAAYEFGRDIWSVMDLYARREKAAKGGYQPEDELFVSDAVINVVLPSVLKGDPTPPVRDGERVANTSDPAEGGVWLATWLDVKSAWEKADLTGAQRDLLVSYYRDSVTQLEISDALGIAQPTVTKRLKAARTKLIDQLGGRKPQDAEPQYRQRPGSQHNSDAIISALR